MEQTLQIAFDSLRIMAEHSHSGTTSVRFRDDFGGTFTVTYTTPTAKRTTTTPTAKRNTTVQTAKRNDCL